MRQAFWAPYKKFVRFIEEQVAKRAAAADSDATKKLESAATSTVNPTAAGKAAAPGTKPKFEVGTVAALGVGLGAIGTLLGGFVAGFLGLGIWMPLGIVGIILAISGPSMLIDRSGLPVALVRVNLHNPSAKRVQAAVAAALPNFIGEDGFELQLDEFRGRLFPQGAQGGVNTWRKNGAVRGLALQSQGVDRSPRSRMERQLLRQPERVEARETRRQHRRSTTGRRRPLAHRTRRTGRRRSAVLNSSL